MRGGGSLSSGPLREALSALGPSVRGAEIGKYRPDAIVIGFCLIES
jgi:hypothetical protein